MSALDRFFGVLVAVAYALQRAKIGFIRLRAAAVVLCGLCAGSASYRVWRAGFSLSGGTAIAASLLLGALLLWADQRRYIVFREWPDMPISQAPDLHAEEKLFVRGSSIFEVSNMTRYLVEVPVVFWTTQLAEHILAAKVRALNVLGVGVPSAERGWWYVFIEPKHVLQVTAGHLCFGFRLRPAVRIQHEGRKGHEFLYLSCDSKDQQARLLKELRSKAETARRCTVQTWAASENITPDPQ